MRTIWPWLLCVCLASCAALRDDMRRAEVSFEQARYEDVQVWLGDLEPSVAQMERPMRSRFYYLSGITAFRLGDKASARHYLALCREEAGEVGLGLRTEWRTNLTTTLIELDAPENTAGGTTSPLSPATPVPST